MEENERNKKTGNRSLVFYNNMYLENGYKNTDDRNVYAIVFLPITINPRIPETNR